MLLQHSRTAELYQRFLRIFREDPLVKNPAWLRWATQVNVNYHDGRMTEDEAETLAGPEPVRYIRRSQTL